jgi:hypothetical protein
MPASLPHGMFECRADLREPLVRSADHDRDRCLVGPSPLVRVTDAGLTPDASARRPRVLRSRITLTAPSRRHATVAEVWFHVDRTLLACSQPGDQLHLVRTACAGLGLSVIRSGALVVAVGAVTALSLGTNAAARIPGDLITRVEAIFRERDPDFQLPETPVEVLVDGARSILSRGQRTHGPYHVWVAHGFLSGLPGTDECAAIWDERLCPKPVAQTSAMLMDHPDALSIQPWQ